MKKIIFILVIFGVVILAKLYATLKFYDLNQDVSNKKVEVYQLEENKEIKNGDLIFQTSVSKQSKAIQLATKSKYSHCGIIYKKDSKFFVLEAVQPVKNTPIEKWIARGLNGKYVIKRLRNADKILNANVLSKMEEIGSQFIGKNYDSTFEWSDDKIYCSELIWKIYQRATGIEIGKPQKLINFDLSNIAVKKKLKDRYGDKIPTDEIVISPASIFDSELLTTVKSN